MPPVNSPGLGGEYEVLFPAYMALKFFKNRKIKNFQLRSNVCGFHKFDDVLIDLEMENGPKHFAIQLKHKENMNFNLTPDSFHTQKDFNLKMYCEAYHKLASDKYNCIIFTNASFGPEKIKKVKKFKMALSENDFVNNLFNLNTDNGNVYKFEANEETDHKEDFEKFFQHFFLFVSQKNIKELEEKIKNIFRTEYKAKDGNISTEYINLFRQWHKRQFTNVILDKKTLSIHLVDLLLGNFVINTTNQVIIRNEKLCLIEESIRAFDVTIVEDSELKLINELSKCEQENFLPFYIEELLNSYANDYKIIGNEMVDQCIFRLSREYKFIDKFQKELKTHDKIKIFNYLLGKPLIINFNNDSRDRIFKVLQMVFRDDINIKFILLGKDIDQAEFGNLKIFKTLQDLRRCNNKLYQKIIKTTEIALQGREKIKLEEITNISEEFEKIIQVEHLCHENLTFGEKLEELPEYYIPRTLLAFVLSEKEVLEMFIKKNNVLVIHYGTEDQYIKNIAQRESLEIIDIYEFMKKIEIIEEGNTEEKCLVVTKGMYIKQQFDKICSATDNNVCFFKINKQRQFILIKSKNDRVNGKLLEEAECPINFCDGINVLCAEPGMGKTSSMKNFGNKCPSDQWAVFLELRQFGPLFQEDNFQNGKIFEHLLYKDNEDVVIKNMRNIFIKQRKISLFLDGLDELDNKSIENVLLFIKVLQEDGFNVWLSSRNNLKDKIEMKLNLFSFDINQVHRDQQRYYINNRLRSNNNYSENQTNKIIDNIFDSVNIQNNSNILGIPLQLFMITQILIDDKHKYSKLSEKQFILTKLYSNYFKGKIKYTFQKNGLGKDFNIKRIVKQILEQYDICALRSCLTDQEFKNLNLSEDKLKRGEKVIIEIMKNGDDYGIIKNVTEDKTVTFVHHTHAEYLAAIYLSKHINKVRILGEGFLTQRYDNLRLFFDLKLAENSPLHLSVLYDNLEQFNEHIANDDSRNIRDKGGRTALHLLCIHGTKYLSLEYKKEEKRVYYDIPSNTKEEKKTFKTMTDTLVKFYPSMTEDEIFQMNEFQYASKSWCLYPLQAILKQKDSNKFLNATETRSLPIRNIFKRNSSIEDINFFLNHNDKGAVAYYAAKFGYQDLIKVLFVGSDFPINKMKYDQKHYTLLHIASIEGHKEVARLLIKKKIQINAVDLFGDTPLHYACLRGHTEIVNLLIQSKANVNATNKYSYTPLNYAYEKDHQEIVKLLIENNAREDNNNVLHDACKKGHYQIVHFLVQNNVDVNSADEAGDTPLHWACRNGHDDVALLLLQNNADVNSVNKNDDTSLHFACLRGHNKIVNLLIRNKANVNSTNKYDYTPLNCAYLKGHWEIVRILIQNNAKEDNIDVLHDACKKGHYNKVLYLVQNNANVNSANKDGDTLLHWACRRGHNKVVLLLIRHNANVNCVNRSGDTPLHWACRNSHKEIVLSLIKNNGNANIANKGGDTPLHWACENGQNEIVILLIENNANINIVNKCGDTPLHRACDGGHQEIASTLIQNNANINSVNSDGEIPLHCAFKNGFNEIAHLLIKNNADVNSVDKCSDTPLQWASKEGHNEIVRLLIENNANINSVNQAGDTALHWACKNGHIKIVLWLIANNANVNSVNTRGDTPLHWTCESGQNEVAITLIQNNAIVNIVNAVGDTPLHWAFRNGHNEIAVLLIQNKANVNSVDQYGKTPLHWACREGYNEIARLLIENNANVNNVDKYRSTPLHWASSKGYNEIALLLIKNNAHVNSTDKYGNTSLHRASRNGHNEIVLLLIRNNANVNCVNKNGDTPLHWACDGGHKETVLLLIENNANINSVNADGDIPLHWAFRKRHNEIALMLIQNNADVNSTNRYGDTALHWACENGQDEIALLLIQNEANVNQYGSTPLHWACKQGYDKIAFLLIQNDANVNSVNDNGDTALHYACMNGSKESALLLIQYGANVNVSGKYGEAPLHWACRKGYNEIALLLIQNNANVNSVNENEETPLHNACMNGYNEVTFLLIQNNANVNSTDKYGYTPLHWACRKGYYEIAVLLIRNNANVNSVAQYGSTPLHWACRTGHNKIALLLIDNNANINSANQYGSTPLHWACTNGHHEIVSLLIENGVNVNSVNESGETPLQWAHMKGHNELVRLLILNNANVNSVIQ